MSYINILNHIGRHFLQLDETKDYYILKTYASKALILEHFKISYILLKHFFIRPHLGLRSWLSKEQ